MRLGGKEIGSDKPVFFIAEMSGNHNHSIERAIKIIEAAAEAGADALKIQTYTPDTMTLDLSSKEFFIEDKTSLWAGKNLYQLYAEAMTPWEWHGPLQKRCRELGMEFFSTPFDASAVDFLEKLDVPFYKIASFENTDLPLIRKVARTGKPLIISTGLATLKEIAETVDTVKAEGNSNLILLQCTSAYPAKVEDANLLTIPNLKSTFNVEIGLSDHTLGSVVPIVSACVGATVIEKHFTLARSDGGVDAAFSMEPAEFKNMISDVRKAQLSLGTVSHGISEVEKKSLRFKRSLYICADLKKGDTLNEANLRAIRPGFGLPPKFIDQFLGKKINQDVARGTPLSWAIIG